MSKAMIVSDGEDNATLRQYEEAVHEAEQEVRESFYHVGMALKRIREEEPFKPKNGQKPNGKTTFKSWAAYCKSDRCRYSKSGADTAIRAAGQRESLPDLKSGQDSWPILWTTETALQMARLDAKKDVNLAIRKIKAELKKGEKFTTKLVKSIVDEILGVTHKKKQKQAKKLAETPHLADAIAEMTETVQDWQDSLSAVEGSSWEEMDAESPEVVKRLTQVLSEFISFLEE